VVVGVAAAGGATTGGDTGAWFDGGNMRVGFGERISTGVAIDAGDADADGADADADADAGEDGGTETHAAARAADTIGLDCTGADGGGFGVALAVGGARSSKEVSSESLSSPRSVPLPLSSSSSLLPLSHMRSAMET